MALVELGRFNYFEAQLLVSRLESDGIMAFAFDSGASIADGAASSSRCESWSTTRILPPPQSFGIYPSLKPAK